MTALLLALLLASGPTVTEASGPTVTGLDYDVIAPELFRRPESRYEYDPKPDITAPELSKIMLLLFRHYQAPWATDTDWDHEIMKLGTAARHFKRFPTQ